MGISQTCTSDATLNSTRLIMSGIPATNTSQPLVRSRVQPAIGPAYDVSRCTGRELAAIYAQAVEREPHLLDQARHESPADDYAIVERFLMLFEAERGEAFRIDGGAR